MNGSAVFLCLLHLPDEDFVFEEVAVFDVTRDARQLLINESSGTDVRVTDFGVAHLTVRQADKFAGSLKMAGIVVCEETVENRSFRCLYRVAFVKLATEAASVHDDECDRCIFEFCHNRFLLLLIL